MDFKFIENNWKLTVRSVNIRVCGLYIYGKTIETNGEPNKYMALMVLSLYKAILIFFYLLK